MTRTHATEEDFMNAWKEVAQEYDLPENPLELPDVMLEYVNKVGDVIEGLVSLASLVFGKDASRYAGAAIEMYLKAIRHDYRARKEAGE